jgi:hypothetical protein
MALVSSTEIRPTDITTFVEFSPLAAGVTLPTSTAAGFRCFYTTRPTKIMAMSVVSGNVTVGGVTYTAAYDVRAIDGTVTPVTTLNTALATTAVTAVASKANVCPIDAQDSDALPPTIPAGAWVGFNIPSTATNASSVCGVLITYRPV